MTIQKSEAITRLSETAVKLKEALAETVVTTNAQIEFIVKLMSEANAKLVEENQALKKQIEELTS